VLTSCTTIVMGGARGGGGQMPRAFALAPGLSINQSINQSIKFISDRNVHSTQVN